MRVFIEQALLDPGRGISYLPTGSGAAARTGRGALRRRGGRWPGGGRLIAVAGVRSAVQGLGGRQPMDSNLAGMAGLKWCLSIFPLKCLLK